jgi:hypothetical protein
MRPKKNVMYVGKDAVMRFTLRNMLPVHVWPVESVAELRRILADFLEVSDRPDAVVVDAREDAAFAGRALRDLEKSLCGMAPVVVLGMAGAAAAQALTVGSEQVVAAGTGMGERLRRALTVALHRSRGPMSAEKLLRKAAMRAELERGSKRAARVA